MRLVGMTLVALLGLVACNTDDADAGDKAAGAVKGVQIDPTKQIDAKNIDKVFDIEESKPAELKPAENLTKTDVKAKTPGGLPPKAVNAKSPGAMPAGPGGIVTPSK